MKQDGGAHGSKVSSIFVAILMRNLNCFFILIQRFMSMQKYSPLAVVSSDDEDNNLRFDYSSAFYWTHADSKRKQQLSNRYKSIFTYNAASLTLDVDSMSEGSHAFMRERNNDYVSLTTECLIIFWCYVFALVTAPLSAWFYVKRIAPNERAILFRLGRLQKIRGPGLTYILPWIDRWKKVDLRMRAFVIPPQHVIMADGAIVEIGSEIRFRVCDVVKSVTAVKDLDQSVRLLGKTCMVNLLQSKNLPELHSEKSLIGSKLLSDLNVATHPWGIEISLVEFSTPKILQAGGKASPVDNVVSCFKSAFNLPNKDNRPISTSTEAKSANGPTHGDNAVRDVMVTNIFPALDKICEQNDRVTGAIYEIVVTGAKNGTYWIDTKTGKWSDEESPSDWRAADVTVKLPDADFLRFVRGDLSAFQAYMSGRISVNGDARLLTELQSLIKMQ